MHRAFLRVIAVLPLFAALVLFGAGCSQAPQVADDSAVFNELDALYTAVTSKRRDLLDACRERMTKLHDDKRISDAGFAEVSAVVALADEDKWMDSAERLYTFMRAQRKKAK